MKIHIQSLDADTLEPCIFCAIAFYIFALSAAMSLALALFYFAWIATP